MRSTAPRVGGPLPRLPPRWMMEDQRNGTEYRPDGLANKGPGGAEEESEEEVDMRLYCVCKQLYDDRFILGCEKCVWFCLSYLFGSLSADGAF